MKTRVERKYVGDLCEVIAGQSPEGRFYNSKGVGMPFYQGKKDFGDKFLEAPNTWTTQTTKIARQGDILMSVRAPVGPVNFATGEICIGRGLAAIRSGIELNRDFLFYQLLYLQPEIEGRNGAVFPSINKSEIKSLPLAFVPLPEQQRIVGILDKAFEGIAAAKANAEKNLQNARAIFESHLKSIFYQCDKDCVKQRLGDVCDEIFAGGDVPKNNYSKVATTKHHIPIYSNGEKNEGLYGYTDAARVTSPCITISARGTIGYTVIRRANFYPAIRLIVAIPNKKLLDLSFLYYAIESIDIGHSGTSIPQLTVPMVREFLVSLPALDRQQNIVTQLDILSTKTQRLESLYQQKLEKLEELKKSLLHQAFAGEL